jgi:hypothetical protein
MKLNGIIDNANNRLIAFCNDILDIPDTYIVTGINPSGLLIGNRYNNGVWEEVLDTSAPENEFKSKYAKDLNRI